MRIGRIQKNGETFSVLFLSDRPYYLQELLGTSERDIRDNFYRVLENLPWDLDVNAQSGKGRVTGPWTYDIPIPRVNQIRDFYAFEDHVKAGRKRRGLEMIPEWYEIPVFYYSGTSSLYASGQQVKYPSYSNELDFELEVAVVIGKEGRDISFHNATEYIAGAIFMNDWSARDEQRHEMKLNLGPAKGKDFGTSIGPYLVTGEELMHRDLGKGAFDIDVFGFVNGKQYSSANTKTMHWTFGQMIERASTDVTLREGDVIASGTVGTGCILELGPEKYNWLSRGDTVVFKSDLLGTLENKIV